STRAGHARVAAGAVRIAGRHALRLRGAGYQRTPLTISPATGSGTGAPRASTATLPAPDGSSTPLKPCSENAVRRLAFSRASSITVSGPCGDWTTRCGTVLPRNAQAEA